MSRNYLMKLFLLYMIDIELNYVPQSDAFDFDVREFINFSAIKKVFSLYASRDDKLLFKLFFFYNSRRRSSVDFESPSKK